MTSDAKRLGQLLADHLKELRARRGFTQYDVVNLTGVPHSSYRRYERNEDESNAGISLETLCSLAKLENCSVSEFLKKIDEQSAGPAEKKESWEKKLLALFKEVSVDTRDDFLAALHNAESDRVIPNPLAWLLKMGVVVFKSERRFQLKIEREVLDEGINNDLFNPLQVGEMIKRIETVIKESFKRR